MRKKITFRERIFLATFFTSLSILLLIVGLSFYQNKKNFQDLKIKEIEAVEKSVQETLNYLSKTHLERKDSVYSERIYELGNIYNISLSLYRQNGQMIYSNRKQFEVLDIQILDKLSKEKKILIENQIDDTNFCKVELFSYLYDKPDGPQRILNIQKTGDYRAQDPKMKVLAKQSVFLVLFLILVSAMVSWGISRLLINRLERVSKQLLVTSVHDLEQPIVYHCEDEIMPLVKSYNQMLHKLQEQKKVLQKTERAEAWKEMARQIVHEINNPLTPLKLTIQNFQRRFRQDDPDNATKVKKLVEVLVHQIDIISAITKSFSDFAKMPVHNNTKVDVVETIRNSVAIFPPNEVVFITNTDRLEYKIDALYLTRIVTNIVKNGLQAIPSDRNRAVNVELTNNKDKFTIAITDNGSGIENDKKDKVFFPNFTTKSEGMGLGLSMVKKIVEDYQGKIWFESQIGFGTTFFIEFYKEINHEK